MCKSECAVICLQFLVICWKLMYCDNFTSDPNVELLKSCWGFIIYSVIYYHAGEGSVKGTSTLFKTEFGMLVNENSREGLRFVYILFHCQNSPAAGQSLLEPLVKICSDLKCQKFKQNVDIWVWGESGECLCFLNVNDVFVLKKKITVLSMKHQKKKNVIRDIHRIPEATGRTDCCGNITKK